MTIIKTLCYSIPVLTDNNLKKVKQELAKQVAKNKGVFMTNFEEGFDKYHNKTSLFPHPFQKVKNPPLTPEEQKLRTAVHQCILNHQKAEEESRQATLTGGHTSLYQGVALQKHTHIR